MNGSPRKPVSVRRSSLSMTMRGTPGPRPPRISASTSTPSDDAPAAPAETAQQHRPPQQPTSTRNHSPQPDTHRMSPRLPSRLLPATGRHSYVHFSQQPQHPPPNLGKPDPPITLRRNTGRTPRHRARRNPPRNPLRRAVRNPLRRGWRRAMRAPGRDTGHTTRHHPEPTLTSTNTPHHSTPRKTRGESAREWAGGEGRAPEGRGRGRREYSRRPLPSSTTPENEPKRPTDPAPYRDWSPPKKPPTQPL